MEDSERLAGGSLLLAWQLKNKNVLIVGGGAVASGRIESVLVADAHITLVSPSSGLHPLTLSHLQSYPDRITHLDRDYAAHADLDGADMVLTALDDPDLSQQIAAECRARRTPVNAADLPASCDFYFGSQIRDGPLQIMISTNGRSPKLANLVRRRIEAAVPAHAGDAIERVGVLRERLKERAPGVGGSVGRRRMRWMIDVCNEWEMDELAGLDDEMIARLLDDGWEKERVPKPEEVGAVSKKATTASTTGSGLANVWAPSALSFVLGAASAAAIFRLYARSR
ncbi:siroheme synthase [Punctularia strigosozonata HHB-11173 SS5]|uniref:siroheme synthase n=1 Tax=Punctularia strigosozonata (strain HHB-11173) TaxID=741275 RepID=UPI0004417D6D|nr:siroheme synthase [Punctularia strigosozonata HHB-11173 SS5]EIN07705.1 siroheme synthase [Punctularia strigosozonata HHB-11173 SS5]